MLAIMGTSAVSAVPAVGAVLIVGVASDISPTAGTGTGADAGICSDADAVFSSFLVTDESIGREGGTVGRDPSFPSNAMPT